MRRIALLAAGLIFLMPTKVKAEEPQLYKTWATAYCTEGTTATGTQTTEGRTVSGKREWFGSTMILWSDDGDGAIKPENYIGTYVVEDTGGDTIKNGYVIDIFIKEQEKAKQFGSRRVIFQIVPSEG